MQKFKLINLKTGLNRPIHSTHRDDAYEEALQKLGWKMVVKDLPEQQEETEPLNFPQFVTGDEVVAMLQKENDTPSGT